MKVDNMKFRRIQKIKIAETEEEIYKKHKKAQLAQNIYRRNPKMPIWTVRELNKEPNLYGRVAFEHLKPFIVNVKQRKEVLSDLIQTLSRTRGIEKGSIRKIKDGIIDQAAGYGMDLHKVFKRKKGTKK